MYKLFETKPINIYFLLGKSELPSHSMGSTNLDELSEYGEAFKRGDFSLDDIERLYKAWHERNRDASSSSIKERKVTFILLYHIKPLWL
jgi:hypothetical protein